MEIFLDNYDEDHPKRFYACDPKSGELFTRIETSGHRAVWHDGSELSAEYECTDGIYWESSEEAEKRLQECGHTVVYED